MRVRRMLGSAIGLSFMLGDGVGCLNRRVEELHSLVVTAVSLPPLAEEGVRRAEEGKDCVWPRI